MNRHTEQRPRNGMRSAGPAGPRYPSSPPMTPCAPTSKTVSPARSPDPTVPVTGPDVRWIGRRHGRRAGPAVGEIVEPEQIANRLQVDFPDDETMRISHEAIYQALYVQGRGALRRELTACLRTGRALRVPGPGPGTGQEVRHPGDHDQRAPGRGRRPGCSRALGRRPHSRPEQLSDRDARRANNSVHDAAAPAAAWKDTATSADEERPRVWPATGRRRSVTRSPRRSQPCPSSSAGH